jgi:hypothetical protein
MGLYPLFLLVTTPEVEEEVLPVEGISELQWGDADGR